MKTKTNSYLLSIATLALALFTTLSLIASTVVEPWYKPPIQGTDSTFDENTYEKLKTLTVSVNWNDISLKEALEDLTSKSQQADAEHSGIKFSSPTSFNAQKISISITNVPIIDILAYLSQQAHLNMKIHKREILLLPLKDVNKPKS